MPQQEESPAADASAFVRRQNKELEALASITELLRAPGRVLTGREKQLVATKGDRTTDCIRCGVSVCTLFNASSPSICATCRDELKARDCEAVPRARWWYEIRAELISQGKAKVTASTEEVTL